LANQQQQDALRQDLALALLRRQAKGETNWNNVAKWPASQ
jgi:hypothetical protein